MKFIKVLRLVLAFAFAAISAACVYWFATLPYVLIERIVTTTTAEPGGDGLALVAVIFAVMALIAAFSGDWSEGP